ncbi:sulfurtransferase complex subunit TusC [Kluyvera cryocrescens]|uniref:sulfurtransferase complex subunit TusC n=1 Tax=Kluyvera cryocrescens TaxID=580 RepID=UPI002DB89D86|nr:sulfurtransferase complex subunit TusC [Kluyvera cryocrescens]MEB7714256.1 sulfurtransferase complex subunit TusC [Kluyvera cryocrescens]
MKRVAFVFSTAPHGSSAGREGLDALLATSALSDESGVFFIGDGVFQPLSQQQPGVILARDYIATFKLLGLYDIDNCWICATSMRERGLSAESSFVTEVEALDAEAIRQKLNDYDVILRF